MYNSREVDRRKIMKPYMGRREDPAEYYRHAAVPAEAVKMFDYNSGRSFKVNTFLYRNTYRGNLPYSKKVQNVFQVSFLDR